MRSNAPFDEIKNAASAPPPSVAANTPAAAGTQAMRSMETHIRKSVSNQSTQDYNQSIQYIPSPPGGLPPTLYLQSTESNESTETTSPPRSPPSTGVYRVHLESTG